MHACLPPMLLSLNSACKLNSMAMCWPMCWPSIRPTTAAKSPTMIPAAPVSDTYNLYQKYIIGSIVAVIFKESLIKVHIDISN